MMTFFLFIFFLVSMFIVNNFLFIKLLELYSNPNSILIKSALNLIIFILCYITANLVTLTMQNLSFLKINKRNILSLSIIIWFFSNIIFQIPIFLGTFFPYLAYKNSLILNSIIFFTIFIFSYTSINISFSLIFGFPFFEEKNKLPST